MKLYFEEMSDYLCVRFTGATTTFEVERQFESIAEFCKRANKNKLVLDFTQASWNLSLVDRYSAGVSARIFVQYGLKVAVVITPVQIDPRRFGEMVAQNRWVNIRVFSDAQSAQEWL